MQIKLRKPFVIETNIKGDYNFFAPYMDQMEWTDTNKLYAKHHEYQETMYGRQMVYHYIKHISNFDMKLKKFVMKLFKDFGVPTKDFRADFFLTKAGGSMPMHVDGMSKVAFLLPLSENTGPLVCKNESDQLELTYQTLTILNTQISHGVNAPTSDRLLFRIAVHDVKFEELGIYKSLENN
jgi:hypothetical protein